MRVRCERERSFGARPKTRRTSVSVGLSVGRSHDKLHRAPLCPGMASGGSGTSHNSQRDPRDYTRMRLRWVVAKPLEHTVGRSPPEWVIPSKGPLLACASRPLPRESPKRSPSQSFRQGLEAVVSRRGVKHIGLKRVKHGLVSKIPHPCFPAGLSRGP